MLKNVLYGVVMLSGVVSHSYLNGSTNNIYARRGGYTFQAVADGCKQECSGFNCVASSNQNSFCNDSANPSCAVVTCS